MATQEKKKQLTLTECAWEEINQPGAYVSRDTGQLFRIPKEALGTGACPVIHQETRMETDLSRSLTIPTCQH